MDKALGWIIKGASVVITAPATVIVAGGLFAEVPGGLRWLLPRCPCRPRWLPIRA